MLTEPIARSFNVAQVFRENATVKCMDFSPSKFDPEFLKKYNSYSMLSYFRWRSLNYLLTQQPNECVQLLEEVK